MLWEPGIAASGADRTTEEHGKTPLFFECHEAARPLPGRFGKLSGGLTIATRIVEGIPVLDMKGRLTAGEGVATLRESVTELSEEDRNNQVLNLKQVEYVDSSGLGALVLCFTSLQRRGGALKLSNLSKRQMELMVLTKLATIFEVFDNEQDAINSFFPGRAVKRFDILEYVRSHNAS
jgi:anti-sigma B factor antagonist